MILRTYTPIWHKYRPVLLKMMMDSTAGPKEYQLSAHEFKAMNPKQKGSFAFTLQVGNGKIKNNVKDNAIAQDLWEVLQLSPKATQLIQESGYQFALDKNYVLHVEALSA